jgi:hypothetical protein
VDYGTIAPSYIEMAKTTQQRTGNAFAGADRVEVCRPC